MDGSVVRSRAALKSARGYMWVRARGGSVSGTRSTWFYREGWHCLRQDTFCGQLVLKGDTVFGMTSLLRKDTLF